jgi:hypothetical protein
MIIIKIEKTGGLWEYHDFDTEEETTKFLVKNPEYKLRLAAISEKSLKDNILERKNYYVKKRSNSGVSG